MDEEDLKQKEKLAEKEKTDKKVVESGQDNKGAVHIGKMVEGYLEEQHKKEQTDRKVSEFIDMLNNKKKNEFESKYKTPGVPLGDMQGPLPAKIKPKKTKKKKKLTKLVSIVILGFTVTICSGCSKNQDVKIVHNYWDRTPSFAERKQETHLDLYVCKNYKAVDNGKTAVIYKVD